MSGGLAPGARPTLGRPLRPAPPPALVHAHGPVPRVAATQGLIRFSRGYQVGGCRPGFQAWGVPVGGAVSHVPCVLASQASMWGLGACARLARARAAAQPRVRGRKGGPQSGPMRPCVAGARPGPCCPQSELGHAQPLPSPPIAAARTPRRRSRGSVPLASTAGALWGPGAAAPGPPSRPTRAPDAPPSRAEERSEPTVFASTCWPIHLPAIRTVSLHHLARTIARTITSASFVILLS